MYKELVLTYNSNLSDKDMDLINKFNQYYKDEEICIEVNSNLVNIYLKEIDIKDIKQRAEKFKPKTDNKQLFDDLIKSIEDVRSYGIKGKKRNYVDFNKERKVKNRTGKEKKRGQYYYARDHNFKKENNELPASHTNKVICNDSLDELKKLPDNCIDIILTSPPYNFGLEYDSNEDEYYWDKYFSNLFQIFDECIRVLKFGERFLVNIQPLFSDYIPSHHIISNYFMSRKIIWKCEIIW